MNAALLIADHDANDFDDQFAAHRCTSPRAIRERSSSDRRFARSRYRRGGRGAASFNGAHRRRDKRNYL